MIKFDNYTIRSLEIEDLNKYFELVYRNRKRLEDFFVGTVSRTKDINATKLFLDELIQKREAKEYFPFLVIDNSTNNFVAYFDIKNLNWSIPKAEIGYYTDEQYAGKGITTKALKFFVNYCFESFNFKKLLIRTHQSNIAAQVLAQKCGFKVEGTIKMDYKTTSGKIVDLIYFGRVNKALF